MYWSDWGDNSSKIERSYLDGSDRRAVVDTDIGWPNGLALDYKSERLYWIDAKKKRLESCDLDGGTRTPLLTDLPHPFGLAIVSTVLLPS